MAIDKIQSESINLADTFAFTGTVTGAGGVNTPFFHAYMGANQTISNTTRTILQFNTERWDTASGFDTGTYSYTIPSGQGGYWIMYLRGRFTLNNTFRMSASFRVNNTDIEFGNSQHQSTETGFQLFSQMNLSAGDVIKTTIYQDRGGNEIVEGGATLSEFSGFKLIQ